MESIRNNGYAYTLGRLNSAVVMVLSELQPAKAADILNELANFMKDR